MVTTLGLSERQEAEKKVVRHLTWQAVTVTVALLLFSSFVLWLTATTFDASEFRTLLGLFGGYAAREFWPVVRYMLRHTTDALAGGGQVE